MSRSHQHWQADTDIYQGSPGMQGVDWVTFDATRGDLLRLVHQDYLPVVGLRALNAALLSDRRLTARDRPGEEPFSASELFAGMRAAAITRLNDMAHKPRGGNRR